ncbi:MAG: hypothetical protein RL414_1337, partial [Actinomycetota bacterium]
MRLLGTTTAPLPRAVADRRPMTRQRRVLGPFQQPRPLELGTHLWLGLHLLPVGRHGTSAPNQP